MAAGNDPQFFKTDISVSNGYWGIVSLVLFLFAVTQKSAKKESFQFLFFAVFALLSSLGEKCFLREFLYKYAPLMDRFQYPGIFRAFTIFGLLAFTGINFNTENIKQADRKKLVIIAALIIAVLLILIFRAVGKTEHFAYFNRESVFAKELFNATRFDNIIVQGVIQIFILSILIFSVLKIKQAKHISAVLLGLFIADGVISTQLSLQYTVISTHNPIEFSRYLKSSPKGFPVPELNPIGENSDKNAANAFTWMNNNVFPKKVTFDGLVSFKTDGYNFLADNYPDLLEAIKKEPVVYYSNDIRNDSLIENFKSNTVFISSDDFKKLKVVDFHAGQNDTLEITGFSPTKIEIKTKTEFSQLLVYQQNYYSGWEVFVDGNRQNLIMSNFTHMSVLVPAGVHTVCFEYKNPLIIIVFAFTSLIFMVLLFLSVKYFINGNPEKKVQVISVLVSLFVLFILVSCINRYFYQKNKTGLSDRIVEKTEQWRRDYKNEISILLSTKENELKNKVKADATVFINEKSNTDGLSNFLMNSRSRYFGFAWQGGIVGEDLFELMGSFYPGIIDKKVTNNSGYILLEKGPAVGSFIVERSFEPEEKGLWQKDYARILVDSVSGSHVYYYDEKEEFGFSAEFQVDKNLLSNRKITVLSDVMFSGKTEEALLVFTTERAGQMKIYQTLDISRFTKYSDKWGRAVFEIEITPELEAGDIIKFYFWNLKKVKFQVDNFRVKFR
jgi:hypothetical protein